MSAPSRRSPPFDATCINSSSVTILSLRQARPPCRGQQSNLTQPRSLLVPPDRAITPFIPLGLTSAATPLSICRLLSRRRVCPSAANLLDHITPIFPYWRSRRVSKPCATRHRDGHASHSLVNQVAFVSAPELCHWQKAAIRG